MQPCSAAQPHVELHAQFRFASLIGAAAAS
jgi:hypothetical protein